MLNARECDTTVHYATCHIEYKSHVHPDCNGLAVSLEHDGTPLVYARLTADTEVQVALKPNNTATEQVHFRIDRIFDLTYDDVNSDLSAPSSSAGKCNRFFTNY